jgi:hypothetical protein
LYLRVVRASLAHRHEHGLRLFQTGVLRQYLRKHKRKKEKKRKKERKHPYV